MPSRIAPLFRRRTFWKRERYDAVGLASKSRLSIEPGFLLFGGFGNPADCATDAMVTRLA